MAENNLRTCNLDIATLGIRKFLLAPIDGKWQIPAQRMEHQPQRMVTIFSAGQTVSGASIALLGSFQKSA